jgi:hypothetical protein
MSIRFITFAHKDPPSTASDHVLHSTISIYQIRSIESHYLPQPQTQHLQPHRQNLQLHQMQTEHQPSLPYYFDLLELLLISVSSFLLLLPSRLRFRLRSFQFRMFRGSAISSIRLSDRGEDGRVDFGICWANFVGGEQKTRHVSC